MIEMQLLGPLANHYVSQSTAADSRQWWIQRCCGVPVKSPSELNLWRLIATFRAPPQCRTSGSVADPASISHQRARQSPKISAHKQQQYLSLLTGRGGQHTQTQESWHHKSVAHQN